MTMQNNTIIHSDNFTNTKQMTDGQLVGFYKWMLKQGRIKVDGAAYRRLVAIERRKMERYSAARMLTDKYYAKKKQVSH